MRSDCIFFCPIRVRYNEVDQQGIVYNGHYVIYTDVAFEEYFRSKGYPYKTLVEEHDSEVCHKKSTYEFYSSAYEGDLLEVGMRVLKIGNKSMTIGELIITCETVYVGYDMKNRASKPISDLMRQLLGA